MENAALEMEFRRYHYFQMGCILQIKHLCSWEKLFETLGSFKFHHVDWSLRNYSSQAGIFKKASYYVAGEIQLSGSHGNTVVFFVGFLKL